MAIVATNTFSTASQADINEAANLKSVSPSKANGGSNIVNVTLQVQDPDGANVAEATLLYVWLSDLANGTGGSAHTHSTAPAFSTGEEIVEHLTNDAWFVLTDENGVAVLKLEDTANEDVTVNAQVAGGAGARASVTTVAGDWSP